MRREASGRCPPKSKSGALDSNPVAITEAPIDALSLALAQMPAIALCGTSGLPSWLVTRMAKPAAPGRSRTVYLAFDADPAGDAAAAKIEGQLSLVHCARLRPQSAKGWNAMLSTQGLDSLRQMPEIARLPVKTTKIPPQQQTPRNRKTRRFPTANAASAAEMSCCIHLRVARDGTGTSVRGAGIAQRS